MKVVLQALRIGDLGICAIPCEVFVEIGLELRKKSPLKQTFTIELANGYNGYLPTPEQHKLGGYETWRARSSYLEVGRLAEDRADAGGVVGEGREVAVIPVVPSSRSAQKGYFSPERRICAEPELGTTGQYAAACRRERGSPAAWIVPVFASMRSITGIGRRPAFAESCAPGRPDRPRRSRRVSRPAAGCRVPAASGGTSRGGGSSRTAGPSPPCPG